MKNHFITRVIAGALIFTLTYTPILGATTGTVAAAQAAQNTTYSYQYDANGNVTQVTDPLGRVTDLAYDALGRSVQQTLPAPQVSAARPVVQYAYDGQDQLSTVTDPRKLVTAYTVDGLGNQGARDSPDTGHTANTYDVAGNVTTSTDARGKVSTYSYDAINRVTRIDYASGPSSVFIYDGGAAGVANAIGKLSAMSDESGGTSYVYDAFGRLASKTQTVVVGSTTRIFNVGYAYGTSGTATGKLASVTYPSGNRVNYLYDTAGQLNRLTLDAAGSANGTAQGRASICSPGFFMRHSAVCSPGTGAIARTRLSTAMQGRSIWTDGSRATRWAMYRRPVRYAMSTTTRRGGFLATHMKDPPQPLPRRCWIKLLLTTTWTG